MSDGAIPPGSAAETSAGSAAQTSPEAGSASETSPEADNAAGDRGPDPSATEIARRGAAAMWADDAASRGLGMRLDQVAPGRARLQMVVTAEMVNGHAIAHGGFVATLADSAFAFACNTYGEVTVAAGFDIVFLNAARLGDELVAEAVERSRRGRSGVYDVTVRRAGEGASAEVVAEFRGRSRSLGRPILPA